MRAIDEIYEALDGDSGYARVPEILCRAAGARSAMMIELDVDMRSLSWVGHQVSDAVIGRYAALDLWEHDVWSHRMARLAYRNRAVRSDEVIDVADFRQSVFYNELYQPLGDDTARCLGVVLDRDDGSLAIGLHRAYGHAAFGKREQATLQALVPHLQRMNAVRSRLRQGEEAISLQSAALDGLPYGVLITDGAGRVKTANRIADQLLRARDTVLLDHGRVRPEDGRAAEHFAGAIRGAATGQGSRGGAIRFQRSHAAWVRAIVTPLPGVSGRALVILDLEERAADVKGVLRGLYRLTEAEAGVSAGIAAGWSANEIAARRQTSVQTVRTQIRAIHQKTDTRTLADLALVLGRLGRLPGGE